ncbi:RNA polymerase sigma factor [Mucilaginibacter dorajii]|uniref:RNA polymerase sigma-70 factor n=1 Tax=Mucilaginibacter dorajii TaxID=692994 RepID=A0ABP7PBK0_9SPHI|nr:RNA polymerase sigma-70 factor [Mucilaginibacter dorajii]MCS3734809.1 RNA polymerase sigma-70 factor (ECF subfamily) [Mucilaginibacter dorajii]
MPIRPIYNENELLNKIASGDVRAFTHLFDSYYKHLGQYVYRLTESTEVAEEIVQDVFVKIWSRRQDLVKVESFTNYLFIITRNRTYRFLKEKATAHVKQQEWEKEYREEHYFPGDVSPEEKFCLIIDKLVEKLPPQQRKVYELSRIGHLKHSEIAGMLNISTETVKKHIMLANKFIKNSISEKNDLLFLLFFMVYVHF